MDYTSAWKIRLSDDEKIRQSLFHEARTAAEKAAQVLVEEFGAEKVYLMGSLLKKDIFTEYSDADIAVSGLRTEKYFRALSTIWGLFPKGMEVDLIPLEDADEYIRSKIFYEGILLYDKERTTCA